MAASVRQALATYLVQPWDVHIPGADEHETLAAMAATLRMVREDMERLTERVDTLDAERQPDGSQEYLGGDQQYNSCRQDQSRR